MINKENSLDIYDLTSEVELLFFEQGVIWFKVTESFNKNGSHLYWLRRLHIDTEDDGVCCCWDDDDILTNNNYVLNGFLSNNVKVYKLDKMQYKMVFKDGEILIQGLAN